MMIPMWVRGAVNREEIGTRCVYICSHLYACVYLTHSPPSLHIYDWQWSQRRGWRRDLSQRRRLWVESDTLEVRGRKVNVEWADTHFSSSSFWWPHRVDILYSRGNSEGKVQKFKKGPKSEDALWFEFNHWLYCCSTICLIIIRFILR